MTKSKSRRRAVAALLTGLLVTVPALAQTSFPLALDNCGFSFTIEQAPERVVSIKSTTTELLAALGLADRIVGRGFEDGPIPARWADMVVAPMLSDRLPSLEVVLETAPDLIISGWESSFVADGVGEREPLAALGVTSYVAPVACRTPPFKPERIGFEETFRQIHEVGRLFDVEDRAEAIVADMRAELDALVPLTGGVTALWYSSGTKTPYVGAGLGGPQMMLEALGVTNVMGDVADSWASVSWEAVADADPDVIVLVDAAWNSAARKIDYLSTDPVTSNLKAVQAGTFVVIPFAAAEPGVRSVEALSDLAAQLRALGFN